MQPTHKMFIQMFIPTIDLPLRNWPMDSFKQRFACSGGYRKCPSNWWRGIVGPAGLEPRPAVRKMSGGHFKAGARLRRGLECDPLIIWHNIPILFQFHQTLVKEGYGISVAKNTEKVPHIIFYKWVFLSPRILYWMRRNINP